MTLKKALEKFDREYRNSVPADLKKEWLSFLDSAIYNDVFLTHQDNPYKSFTGYTDSVPDSTELLVPDPYSRLYTAYLAMKTDLYLGDITRYNNDLVIYSAAYGDFEKYYNKNHLPIKLTSYFNA